MQTQPQYKTRSACLLYTSQAQYHIENDIVSCRQKGQHFIHRGILQQRFALEIPYLYDSYDSNAEEERDVKHCKQLGLQQRTAVSLRRTQHSDRREVDVSRLQNQLGNKIRDEEEHQQHRYQHDGPQRLLNDVKSLGIADQAVVDMKRIKSCFLNLHSLSLIHI